MKSLALALPILEMNHFLPLSQFPHKLVRQDPNYYISSSAIYKIRITGKAYAESKQNDAFCAYIQSQICCKCQSHVRLDS